MKKSFSLLEFLTMAIVVFLFFKGCTCSKEEMVPLVNPSSTDIIPSFTIYPETGNSNTLFEFDASASEYVAGPDSIMQYKWDFDGDDIYDTELSYSTYTSHIYGVAGNFSVRLFVEATSFHYHSNSITKNLYVAPASGEWPTLTTAAVTNVLETSASCGGEVTDEGGAAVTSRGICWSPSNGPTINDSFTEEGSGPGAFTSTMTDLEINQTYYVRAYAINDIGTGYGATNTFTTTFSTGPCPGTPSVEWQGETYNTTMIGDQCWMNRNLNWETGNSACYDEDPANCEKYGRLYDWATVMDGALSSNTVPSGVQGICPPGWHIPSDEEWMILEAVVDPDHAIDAPIWHESGVRSQWTGRNLKSNSGWHLSGNGDDVFGFTALPGGLRSESGEFKLEQKEAYWWSSTESGNNTDAAYHRNLHYYFSGSNRGAELKNHYFSVRCLKD